MNISLLIFCLTIITVQTYFIIHDWVIVFLLKKIEMKKKNDVKRELEENRTEVFPGAITKDMIENNEVIRVSRRT